MMRGYLPIANTPFDEQGQILWDDLQCECDLAARSGVGGLVWPVNDSEFALLSFPERVEGMRHVVDAVGRRIPVILGVADTSLSGAAALAEAAARAGADRVIAMPPWHVKLGTRAQLVDYYRAIATASGLPVCLQNFSAPMGSDLTPDIVAEICAAVPQVQYIKEECVPQPDHVRAVLDRHVPGLKAVYGGGWALDMVTLHKLGADGNMASSAVPEVHARVWALMEAGQEDEARRLQALLNETMRAETATQGLRGVKQGHVLRGVFRSAALRNVAARPLGAD